MRSRGGPWPSSGQAHRPAPGPRDPSTRRRTATGAPGDTCAAKAASGEGGTREPDRAADALPIGRPSSGRHASDRSSADLGSAMGVQHGRTSRTTANHACGMSPGSGVARSIPPRGNASVLPAALCGWRLRPTRAGRRSRRMTGMRVRVRRRGGGGPPAGRRPPSRGLPDETSRRRGIRRLHEDPGRRAV